MPGSDLSQTWCSPLPTSCSHWRWMMQRQDYSAPSACSVEVKHLISKKYEMNEAMKYHNEKMQRAIICVMSCVCWVLLCILTFKACKRVIQLGVCVCVSVCRPSGSGGGREGGCPSGANCGSLEGSYHYYSTILLLRLREGYMLTKWTAN